MGKHQRCENPECRHRKRDLSNAEIEGEGTRKLCKKCFLYALLYGKYRPRKEHHKQKEVEERPVPIRCQNPHCLSKNIEGGGFSEENGKFYCAYCGYYYQTYHKEMPKNLVDRCNGVPKKKKKAGEGDADDKPEEHEKEPCENPSCGRLMGRLFLCEVGNLGTLKLCGKCKNYAVKNDEFRPPERQPKSRRKPPECCENPNCQTTNLKWGGRYRDKFYCNTCRTYAKMHNGEERPKRLASRQYRKVPECCDNPKCRTKELNMAQFFGDHYYCCACYTYARRHDGELRPLDVRRQPRSKNRTTQEQPAKSGEKVHEKAVESDKQEGKETPDNKGSADEASPNNLESVEETPKNAKRADDEASRNAKRAKTS